MKRWIQWGLCGMLSIFTIAGIVVALIGAVNNPPQVVMVISGTLMVAVASFALTLLAKVLG